MLSEQALRLASGFFLGIFIARYLGPESFGILNYAIALSVFTATISRFGLDSILIRELTNAPHKNRPLMGTAFFIIFLGSCATYSITLLATWLSNEPKSIKIYISILTFCTLLTPFLTLDYLNQASLRSKHSTICKTLALAISSAIKVALLITESELLWFIIATISETILLSVFLVTSYHLQGKINFISCLDLKTAKDLLRSSLPMTLSAIAALACIRIDQLMIRNMLGLYELGTYSAATKMFEAWTTLPYIITISAFPIILRLKNEDSQNYQRLLTILTRSLFYLSTAIAVITTIYGAEIFDLAFGSNYKSGSTVMMITMWSSLFFSLGSVSNRYFTTEKTEKKIVYRIFLSATLNATLNYLLIPQFGINGAAYASLASAFFAYYLIDFIDKDSKELLNIKNRAIFFTR